MDVSIEKRGALGRRLKITVPLSEVETRVARRIRRLGRTVRMDGFRAGKVPERVLRQRYGKSVFQEVASDVIEASYLQALADHKLVLAGEPDFSNTRVLSGQDLHFVVDIEVYPEFELAPLDAEKLEKQVAEVTDDDVARVIELSRLRNAKWRPVQRCPQKGDRVRVHIGEKIAAFNVDENGELPVSMDASGIEGDFASQLLKCKPGDSRKIRIKFPRDYPDTRWAGKKLKFRVEARAVEESVLPDLDQEFFRRCGVEEGGLDRLKELFREGMQYELTKKLRRNMKEQVMDLLMRRHDVALPPVLVQRETARMRAETIEQLGLDEEKAAELDDRSFREHAERNIKLGIIMRKIAEAQKLEVDSREFEASLGQIAAQHEDAEAVERYYRSDRQARSKLTGLILEEKVFRWVLDQVRLEDTKCTFDEVVRSEGYGEGRKSGGA